MAIEMDCPICGCKRVKGRLYEDDDDRKLNAVETVIGGVAGFFVGGPLGAAVGATAMHKGFKFFSKREHMSNGKSLFRFNCPNPNCKHEWTEFYNE